MKQHYIHEHRIYSNHNMFYLYFEFIGYTMSLIETTTNVNLDLSMYPSFVSALFVKDDNKWIKIAGYRIGATIYSYNNTIICEECDEHSFSEWSGLWFNPNNYMYCIKKNREQVLELINYYKGLRIIVSSFDRPFILALTFLSRNTSFHQNVRCWSKIIFNWLEYFEVNTIRRRIEKISKRSYQLNQLLNVIDYFPSINFDNNPWKLRRDLMEIKYMGPKVIDAFLLFGGYSTVFAPVDIHLRRFSTGLKLIPSDVELIMPSKKYCLEYDAFCPQCPLRDKCVFGVFRSLYGCLSGFLQTIAYVHDRLWCSKNKCFTCPFSTICFR